MKVRVTNYLEQAKRFLTLFNTAYLCALLFVTTIALPNDVAANTTLFSIAQATQEVVSVDADQTYHHYSQKHARRSSQDKFKVRSFGNIRCQSSLHSVAQNELAVVPELVPDNIGIPTPYYYQFLFRSALF